jgi:NADPH:quinone reductase-like Zn-dependent oxidoreductase
MPDIPDTMRAMLLTGHGDLDRLVFTDSHPTPRPGPGEVLIRVAACGLNNTDVNTRTAWYSRGVSDATTGDAFDTAGSDDASWGGAAIRFPRIQGADVAGRVAALGEGANAALIGRRVLVDTWLRDWDDPLDPDRAGYFGSECDGGYAEYTVVDQRNVHPVESDLGDAELATFATSYVTAENMLNRAAVGAGDVVLIPGASGGVGSALIQLANRRGARSVALCGEDKAEAVAAIGAEAVLPRAPQDLRAQLRASIGRNTVHVVADVVGGALWPQLIDALARQGRYTCAGAIAGPMVRFDLRTFYLRDLTFTGATVVPPGVFADLVGYIERGEIRPLLAATWPLEQLRAAQQAFIDKRHVGNLVVEIDGERSSPSR